MAYTSSISSYSTNTTERVRQWGQGISQGLVTAGLVNTNASGSVNWSTVVSSTGSAFEYGYEVFRLNDALQSTAPIFLRLTYTNRDVAPPNATAPRIVVQLGTTHDGSGTLGGQLFATGTTALRFTGGLRNDGAFNSLFAAGDGWMTAAFFYDINSITNSWFIGIERTRDYNGNPTPDGFGWILGGADNGGGWRTGYVPFSGTVPNFQSRLPILISPALNNPPSILPVTNGNANIHRVYWFNGGVLPVPSTIGMFPLQNLFAYNRTFTFSPFVGTTARYFKLPKNFVDISSGILDAGFVMRIE